LAILVGQAVNELFGQSKMPSTDTRILHPKAGGVDLYVLVCYREMSKPLFDRNKNHPAMPESLKEIFALNDEWRTQSDKPLDSSTSELKRRPRDLLTTQV